MNYRQYPRHSRIEKWKAAVLLLLIVAFWGATFPIVDQATNSFGVMSFLFLRFALAAYLMGAVCRLQVRPATLLAGMLIGWLPGAAYVAQTYGFQFTTSTNMGLITGLSIVFVPIANWLLFRERTGAIYWIGIGVSVVGLVLLTGRGPDEGRFGDLLGLFCAVGFGTHIAVLDRWAGNHNALQLAFGQLLSMALIFGIVRPFIEPAALPSVGVGMAILVTAIVCSAAAFFVQVYAQQRLSAVQAAAIIMTEPVFAAAFSRIWLGERLGGIQWLGAVLMLSAIVFVSLQPDEPNPKPTHDADDEGSGRD